jgi:hypothetical protein
MDSLRRIDGTPRFGGPQPPLTETPSASSAARPASSSARLVRELLNLSVSLFGFLFQKVQRDGQKSIAVRPQFLADALLNP